MKVSSKLLFEEKYVNSETRYRIPENILYTREYSLINEYFCIVFIIVLLFFY